MLLPTNRMREFENLFGTLVPEESTPTTGGVHIAVDHLTDRQAAMFAFGQNLCPEDAADLIQQLLCTREQPAALPTTAPTAPTAPAAPAAPAPDASEIAFQCANRATLNTAKATAKRFLKLEFEQKKAAATTAADAFALADAYQKAVAEVTAATDEEKVWAVTL